MIVSKVPLRVPARCAPPYGGFRLFNALFHRPPHAAEPHQHAAGDTPWGLADVVPIPGLLPQRPLQDQPDCLGRLSVLAKRHPFPCELIRARALGPCKDGTPIPKRGRNLLRKGRHRREHVVWGDHGPLQEETVLLQIAQAYEAVSSSRGYRPRLATA